jgi:uncharacterized protein
MAAYAAVYSQSAGRPSGFVRYAKGLVGREAERTLQFMKKECNTDEKPWYSEGLAFECTQCGDCCSGPDEGYVWVTPEEVLELAAAIGMSDQLGEFEKKFTRKVGSQTSLVEYSDGDCIFLDPKTRGCSVYTARPVQCRTWPFWKGNVKTSKAWAQTAKSCPGCNQGRLYSLSEIQSSLSKDDGKF